MNRRVDGRAAGLPPLYGEHGRWGLIEGDAMALLAALPADSFHALVTDPPYGLAFRGEHWDGGDLSDGEGFQAFTRDWAVETLRVLKPGAWAAVHGAPRTAHRLTSGLKDAGFEIRDQMIWCFAGVQKSRRMPGGLGSGLRPAWEPIVLARKPLDPRAKTIAGNLDRHGTGALHISGTRIARPIDERGTDGYWPPNMVLSHDEACDPTRGACTSTCPVPLIDSIATAERRDGAPPFSRLFYAAKATRAEREAGLDHLPQSLSPIFSGGSGALPRACTHPTVKPLSLMRWVTRLVAPPEGVLLDPFAGSGSTIAAAVLEGRAGLGIEREPEYAAIARGRIAHWSRHGKRAGGRGT